MLQNLKITLHENTKFKLSEILRIHFKVYFNKGESDILNEMITGTL